MLNIKPTELRVSPDKRLLTIAFGDGKSLQFSAEMLRVMSPSAEVQGHTRDQRKVVGGKRQVEIVKIDPIGNYAIRIHFDDLHNTGIYSWTFFHTLGQEHESRWSQYLQELDERGLTRDRED